MTHPSQVGPTHSLPQCCWRHVLEPLQEEGRLDPGRSCPASAWTLLATCSLRTSSRLRINAPSYHDMLRSNCEDVLRSFCGADAFLQHHGGPSHTALTIRALLGEMFRETLAWPAPSPDLSPNFHALWVLWESLIAQENPTDATTLRAAIIKTHAKITGDQIQRMTWHFTRRLRLCLAADGAYFTASLR